MTFGIDAPADVPQDRSPVAAARRATTAENGQSAIAAMVDLQLWDMRLSAILNTIAMAMEHAKQRDWSQDHARQIREMMAITDKVASGDGLGVIPAGFGPVARTAQAAALVQIAAKIAAASGEAAEGEGGQQA
jgi:hypothetical protein